MFKYHRLYLIIMPKMKIRTTIIGADFETDNNGVDEAWVCQWATVRMRDRSSNDVDYTEKHGYHLAEFTRYIDSLLEHPSVNYKIYFHNLKYDFQFMREYLYSLQCRFYGTDQSLIIIRKGSPIIMRFGNVEFRDSANKMPAGTTVQAMGDMLGMPKLESPRENFDAGWSKDLTDDDFQYVIRDALIVGTMMQKVHRSGRTHATTSGDAFASARAIFNKHHNINGFGQFDKYFPQLSVALDTKLRPGYFGGVNISQHVGCIIGNIIHEDVNSMYPTVMMYDLLPYGVPKRTNDPVADGFQLFVIIADMRFHLKEGELPCLRFKGKFDRDLEGMSSTDYVTDCKEWHHMTFTNIDMETFSDFYDIEIDANTVEYFGFNAEVGLLKEYLEYWFEEKKNAPKNSVERMNAKLMLNTVYGRFGMSPMETDSSFVYDPELGDYKVVSDEYIGEETHGYIPFAMFVTAHARRRLLECVRSVGAENVIHCDTDSVIHLGEPSPLGHTDELGDWGIESTPVRMYEGGVKRYIEFHAPEPKTLKDITLTCAGVPQKQKDGIPSGMWIELLDDPTAIYDTGKVLGQEHYKVRSQWLRDLLISGGKDPDDMDTRKLLPKTVKGGRLLVPSTFKLHDVMVRGFK